MTEGDSGRRRVVKRETDKGRAKEKESVRDRTSEKRNSEIERDR